jgi:flagellar FliL protein
MSEDKKEKKGKKGGDEEGKPKGRSNLVPAIVIAVGLVLGGKMMGGKAAPAAATTPPAPAEQLDCAKQDELKPPKEGSVVDLDAQVINLAEGRYAKIGIALQLSAAEDAQVFKDEGLGAKAANEAIAIIAGRQAEDLIDHRADVQEQLTDAIRPLYDCKVLDVLYSEFVVQ